MMGIGEAVKAMQEGNAVRRAGWNGKGMFIVIMPALQLPPFNTQDTARKVNDRTAKWIGEDQPLNCQPYVAFYNAQKQWQPGWVCSQADLLAVDWEIVPALKIRMKYDDAFKVAACTVWLHVSIGLRYRIGVTRAAASAIVGLNGEEAVGAMSRIFQAYTLCEAQ